MPKFEEMVDYIFKVYLKLRDTQLEEASNPFFKGMWLVMPSTQASKVSAMNELLRKIGIRALLLPNEQANHKFNSARGVWPYLASIWESQPSDDFHQGTIDQHTS